MFFGPATNYLSVLGVCTIVFWIICWLILVSKNDNLPKWISNLASLIIGLLAFCTAIPSALLALPIWLNFHKSFIEISRKEYRRGLDEKYSESSKQIQDAYDSGYRAAEKEFHAKFDRFIKAKNRELYEARQALSREDHNV